MDLPTGALLGGRYIVETVLGRGGFATVYGAKHAQLGSRHAVKVLHAGADEDMRGRMLGEGRIQARLFHKNVVRVTDVVELPDGVALVMDFVEGETLRALLDRGAPPLPVARSLADGLLEGVAAAHAAGLIHRDLKPDNVLVGTDGTPRITDFGLARAEDPRLRGAKTQAGVGMGTPGYMAPEAYTDVATVDVRADVFALGAVLYELLCGQRASPGTHPWFVHYQRASNGDYARLDALVPDLPSSLVDAVHAALDPRPDARPDSVAALAEIWRGKVSAPAPAPAPAPAADTLRVDASPEDAASEPARAAPPPAAPLPRALPAERDAFVGREHELRALDQMLHGGARLVTVLGLGGTGKTRLVVRYGWVHHPAWPGGVWFCDLSEARSVNGIAYAVATALDVPLGKDDPIVQLGHAIAGRGRCLVVLDNFEQVTRHAAETVGRWLDRAAQASFVVTSREVLGLPGEATFALAPLDPDDAVALFVARATQAKQDFALTEADRPRVHSLVTLLDGLPLAIELAAARVRVMTPSVLVERMKQRFRVLTSTGGRPTRQATLRAMLDWSWELLSPDEQQALAQLSVFEGGFTLEAAEAVLVLEEAWPMDAVQALVDKSLVRRVTDERFDLLVSVQEYAAEKLDALGARAASEARHGAYLAGYGTDAAVEALDTHGGVERRRALTAELDNLVAAIRRAVGRADGGVAVGLLAAAWAVLELRGPFVVAVELARSVREVPTLPDAARGGVSWILAKALHWAGRMDEARVHYDAALALHREVGDRRAEGKVLGSLGNLHAQQGRGDEARVHYDQALTIAREVGDRRFEGNVLSNLGILHAQQGRPDEARAHFDQAFALAREGGNRRFEGVVLVSLGILHLEQGRMDEARAHFDQAFTLAREGGNRRFEGIVLVNLGNLRRLQGRMDEARAYYEQALGIAREVGDRRTEGIVLDHLGNLHLKHGRMDEARAALEAGELLLRAVKHPLELGKLLATRARLEHADGRPALAHHTLAEAEALAQQAGAGPDSELGQALAKARADLAAP